MYNYLFAGPNVIHLEEGILILKVAEKSLSNLKLF